MSAKVMCFVTVVALGSGWAAAQEYRISQGGTVTTCTGIFYDSGGPTEPYQDFENYTMTIAPGVPEYDVRCTFMWFQAETGYDFLTVYDGPSTMFPVIGVFSGGTSPGAITATNPSGALTFHFTSDFLVVSPGWEAIITCIPPPPTGACCTVSSCNMMTEAGCDGVYHGDYTSCTAQPYLCGGACCFPDLHCEDGIMMGDCILSHGGAYRGDRVACWTITCTPYCFYELYLTDTGGDGWSGAMITVSVNGTPLVIDATLDNGYGWVVRGVFAASTGDTVQAHITNAGNSPDEIGYYILDYWGRVVCDRPAQPSGPGDCTFTSDCTPPPTGSCCYASGSCAETTEAGCGDGTWTLDGVCDPNTCPQPPGACCYYPVPPPPSGDPYPDYYTVACVDASAAECAGAYAGSFHGVSTTCATFTCPIPSCLADCDCDGNIGFSDIDYFVVMIPDGIGPWTALYQARHSGANPPCSFLNGDVDANLHVGFTDIDGFVTRIPSACPLPRP